MTKTQTRTADLLASLLAQVDALFDPVNTLTNVKAGQAKWQRQFKYLGVPGWPGAGLLPWKNPGADPAECKRISRTISKLQGQGLVRTNGKNVALTSEGLTEARRQLGHLQLEDCLPGLDYFLTFLGGPDEWTDTTSAGVTTDGLISECSLLGFSAMPDGEVGGTRLPTEAYITLDAILPLLIADLLRAKYHPAVEFPLYHLTDAGRKLAEQRRDSGKAKPGAWLKLKSRLSAYKDNDAYYNSLEAERSALEFIEPIRPNCIERRLSGFVWPKSLLSKQGQGKGRKEALEV